MNDHNSWQISALNELENSSLSLGEIAAKYGRTVRTISKLLARSGVIRKNQPSRRGPKQLLNNVALSRTHHAIGLRLAMARAKSAGGYAEFAQVLGVSVWVLKTMEVGQHDYKLSQLQTISEVLKLSIADMMVSFERNIYQGRDDARH